MDEENIFFLITAASASKELTSETRENRVNHGTHGGGWKTEKFVGRETETAAPCNTDLNLNI